MKFHFVAYLFKYTVMFTVLAVRYYLLVTFVGNA